MLDTDSAVETFRSGLRLDHMSVGSFGSGLLSFGKLHHILLQLLIALGKETG